MHQFWELLCCLDKTSCRLLTLHGSCTLCAVLDWSGPSPRLFWSWRIRWTLIKWRRACMLSLTLIKVSQIWKTGCLKLLARKVKKTRLKSMFLKPLKRASIWWNTSQKLFNLVQSPSSRKNTSICQYSVPFSPLSFILLQKIIRTLLQQLHSSSELLLVCFVDILVC